ncbi:MAG: hypothetical protein SO118_08385 [Candidatus Onthomorpha sp.]|nr:hypothetical protein [Candidatus Onthomorpha sp.]
MENLIKTSCKQNGSLTYAFFDFCCLFALFGINNKIIKNFFAMIVGLSCAWSAFLSLLTKQNGGLTARFEKSVAAYSGNSRKFANSFRRINIKSKIGQSYVESNKDFQRFGRASVRTSQA